MHGTLGFDLGHLLAVSLRELRSSFGVVFCALGRPLPHDRILKLVFFMRLATQTEVGAVRRKFREFVLRMCVPAKHSATQAGHLRALRTGFKLFSCFFRAAFERLLCLRLTLSCDCSMCVEGGLGALHGSIGCPTSSHLVCGDS